MTYAPLQPATLADPFPVYQWLRQHQPVMWHAELHAWVISRYVECKQVLSDPANYSRNYVKLLSGVDGDPEHMTIQSHDPPHSLPFRRAIAVALERTDVESVCRAAGDKFDSLIALCLDRGPFEFMSQVSGPVATTFACRLIGVPEMPAGAYHSMFLRITRAMDSSLEPERQSPGLAATEELNALVADAMPHAELGSLLYELQRMDGVQGLSPGYVRNTISAMFNAAYSTAYTSMGSFLKLILENPCVAGKILSLESHGAAVQELLRLTSPAQATMRFASNDLELGGKAIRKTDPVITLLASANHDSAQFERPDEFIPDRSPSNHLGFGWGPHFCVGAMPAQQFLRHFLKRIGSHVAELEFSSQPQWLETVTLRCLESLQLVRKGGGAPPRSIPAARNQEATA